jgi:hypothetical protein
VNRQNFEADLVLLQGEISMLFHLFQTLEGVKVKVMLCGARAEVVKVELDDHTAKKNMFVKPVLNL